MSLFILGCYLKNKKFENNVVWTGYALIYNQFFIFEINKIAELFSNDIDIHILLNHSLKVGFNGEIRINNETTSFDEVKGEYGNGKYFHLYGYVNSVKLFLPYLEKLKKKIFRFKDSYVKSAKNKLSNVGCVKKSVTSVSIHVRMGDYSDLLHGIPEAATTAYFTRAMNYFVLKYKVMLFAL